MLNRLIFFIFSKTVRVISIIIVFNLVQSVPPSWQLSFDKHRQRPAVTVGQTTSWNVILKTTYETPPPDHFKLTILFISKLSAVCQGVVYRPGPGGHPIAKQNIYTVVTSSKQQSRHAEQEKKKGKPV